MGLPGACLHHARSLIALGFLLLGSLRGDGPPPSAPSGILSNKMRVLQVRAVAMNVMTTFTNLG
jgi:hypothetical protein